MWIIPSSHPLYSHFAPECLASKEDLNLLSDQFEHSLMWKSKPSSLKTWLSRWSKVYWIPHLFGRMLKPSQSKSFTDMYTASLEGSRVSHLATQGFVKHKTIHDTYGRLLSVALKNRGLHGVGLKMWKASLQQVLTLYSRTYTNLVTRLRLDYSRRQKSELPIEETGSLFSRWKTPSASECEGGTIKSLRDNKTGDLKWPTPVSSEATKAWEGNNQDSLTRMAYRGQLDPGSNNTPGKDHALNPSWVMQLMGTTLEKTFFEWQAMPSLNNKQQKRS